MHPQSYQETQQYQAHYGYAANHNQYGQSVGNAQLNGNQNQSSSLNWQGHCTPSQHPLSSQHGTNASQANYHGNGSYGISSSNQNPQYLPAVPTSACIPGSSHGYIIQQASAQNMQMVQPHQRAVAQSTHIPSSRPTQTWHVRNNTQSFLAQNMPRESAQDWCLLNNSQTMMNVTAPNQGFQMSNGQPQIAGNNPSVNRYSHQAQTVQLPQSSYQSVTDSSVNNHNKSSYSCQALQLKQASNQAQAQITLYDTHYISNQGSNGHIHSSHGTLNNSKVKKSFQRLTLRNNNVVQVYPPNPVNHEQQNNQTNRMLNTECSVVEPKQNDQIPSRMNCQNLTPVSSERLIYRIIKGQVLRRNSTATSNTMTSSRLCSNMPNSAPVSSAVNGTPPLYHDTILSRNSAHTNQNSPPKLTSPGLYINSPTNSLLVPSGMNRLQSPHFQTHSLAAMSNNMNASSSGYCGFLPATASNNGCSLPPHLMSGSPSSVDTNQTDPTSSGNSSRNAGRAPTHPNSSSVHGAPVQQQSPPFDSAQQTVHKEHLLPRNVDVHSNHTPNMADKLAKAMKGNNPLLSYLLVKDSMQTTDQNIECNDYNAPIMQVSPSRSVQTHRAVAVVPPISKQPAGGDKRMECNDHLSLLIQFLANGKETKEDVETDCAAATKTLLGVTSSVVGCPPEDDVTDKSAICSKGNPLNLSSENKDISKDENSKQSSEAHAFFGIPVETFSLRMVRELVVGLHLAEEDQGKTNESGMTENTPDFARSILDLYWGGKYENYFEAELGGMFEKLLTEAAEFDTGKDVKVFDAMKVEDLNWLNQMGCTLTNFCDGGAAMEVNESSWRNNDDESLDIDKELSYFMRQVRGSLKQHSDNQCPASKSLNEESVSKEDLQPSSSVAESDTVFLENENCTVMAMQAKHVRLDSQAELKQNMAIPTTSKNNSQDDSRQDDKEDYLSLQVQVSLGNLNGHSNQDHACVDPLRDTVHKTPEKCEDKSSTKCFRGGSDCTAALKTTNSSSEDFVNLGGDSKDSNCKKYLTEEDCTLSVSLCEQMKQSEKECGTSPCDAMSHIKLTVLSSEIESKKVDSENQHQDLIISGQKGPPSPIVISEHSSESDLGSPKSPDDHLLSMQITVLSRDELKALSVEFYSDSENNVHNAGMSSLICVDSEDDDSQLDSVHSCQTDGETSQTTKQEEISTIIGEEIPSVQSIKEALSLLQTNMTENPNNHMNNSAGKEPTSPLKDSRKRKDPQERHLQNEQDQHPSQPCHSPPLKKCRVEPLIGDFEKSVKLAASLSPSGQSIPDMATKYSQKSDADMTKTPDNKVHCDNAVSLSAALRDNVLNFRAGSSESPEMPKSSGVDKKRKSVTFKLYGSEKVVVKETNGKTQNNTDSYHNLPPLLNILYSPDKTSARDKIRKSWEDSFVQKRSGSESEKREKDVLERPVEWHQKSSGEKNQRSSGNKQQLDRKLSKHKDEQWQQQSSETKHQSKHKKHKHKSLSLTELRREAEKMGKSSKSPQEKQKMGLSIIKQYKRIHKKM